MIVNVQCSLPQLRVIRVKCKSSYLNQLSKTSTEELIMFFPLSQTIPTWIKTSGVPKNKLLNMPLLIPLHLAVVAVQLSKMEKEGPQSSKITII